MTWTSLFKKAVFLVGVAIPNVMYYAWTTREDATVAVAKPEAPVRLPAGEPSPAPPH